MCAEPEERLLAPHEEFTRARQRGIPMLVFVKQGIEVEPLQQGFIDRVEEYTGGRFRASFRTAIDLQPKVAGALAEIAAQQAPLAYTPLPATALWVPVIRTHHATCAYSWISPPRRSRRTTPPTGRTTGGSVGPSGGACPKARCGR